MAFHIWLVYHELLCSACGVGLSKITKVVLVQGIAGEQYDFLSACLRFFRCNVSAWQVFVWTQSGDYHCIDPPLAGSTRGFQWNGRRRCGSRTVPPTTPEGPSAPSSLSGCVSRWGMGLGALSSTTSFLAQVPAPYNQSQCVQLGNNGVSRPNDIVCIFGVIFF